MHSIQARIIFYKLRCTLGKNLFALAAFLVPIAIRSIPSALAWPYPIGFDTVTYYAPLIQQEWVLTLEPIGLLKTTSMFYLLASFLKAFIGNTIVVVNILGPLLLGILCFMLYVYAKRGLNWGNWKALLVVILVSTYFVSLLASRDLHRQTLGLIFLMITIISLDTINGYKKYYLALFSTILTILSHELAAFILLFIIGLKITSFLVNKSNKKDIIYSAILVALGSALFLFQRYSPQTGELSLAINGVASAPSAGLAIYMGGLLIYCYALILPFVFLGLTSIKKSSLTYWTFLCIGIVLLNMLNPNLPTFYWHRWVILMVYPLLFFATEGIEKLWQSTKKFKGRIRKLAPKVFVVAYLFIIFTLSGFYLTSTPDKAIPYFAQDNSYLAAIPSSMLQNSIPIEENQPLIDCLEWLNYNTSNNAIVVEHYSLYGLATIHMPNRIIIPTIEDTSIYSNIINESILTNKITSIAEEASDNDRNEVYTVWWIRGKGWYGITSLPTNFKESYQSGNMAVYHYEPDA